ncbi:MAG TPA: GNAT family N-acetyltransferase [Gemmatimonadales bacterium]|nr:GNAT family N-acetyltransferase [Gemmatimonadales bacterium]
MNLDTERLRLRPLRDDDLDAYAELCADPEVMCYVKYWVKASPSRPRARQSWAVSGV